MADESPEDLLTDEAIDFCRKLLRGDASIRISKDPHSSDIFIALFSKRRSPND